MIQDTATSPLAEAPVPGQNGLAGADGRPKNGKPFAFIVDDQDGICRIVATALTRLGVESTTFRTAKPAIAALDQRHPDIMFLDVALEHSDAIDVIKGISEKRYTGIVQLMSGGRPALLEAVQRIGARYGLVLRPPLQKPFRAEAIREVIVSAGLADESAPLPGPDAA
jgi:DNA-binding NtrC family response regulator